MNRYSRLERTIWIAVVDTEPARRGQVLCYRQVYFTVRTNEVVGIPGSPRTTCGLRETY